MPYDVSRIRWLLFVAWLGSGVSGIWPETVQRLFGPVERLLPLARQVAAAVGPWLLALLDVQRQASEVPEAGGAPLLRVAKGDSQQRLFAAGELQRESSELEEALEAELARLVRLTAAAYVPACPGWLAWEVRYWALAVCLVRLGQLYAALEQAQGSLAAQRALTGVAARIWQRACAVA